MKRWFSRLQLYFNVNKFIARLFPLVTAGLGYGAAYAIHQQPEVVPVKAQSPTQVVCDCRTSPQVTCIPQKLKDVNVYIDGRRVPK